MYAYTHITTQIEVDSISGAPRYSLVPSPSHTSHPEVVTKWLNTITIEKTSIIKLKILKVCFYSINCMISRLGFHTFNC